MTEHPSRVQKQKECLDPRRTVHHNFCKEGTFEVGRGRTVRRLGMSFHWQRQYLLENAFACENTATYHCPSLPGYRQKTNVRILLLVSRTDCNLHPIPWRRQDSYDSKGWARSCTPSEVATVFTFPAVQNTNDKFRTACAGETLQEIYLKVDDESIKRSSMYTIADTARADTSELVKQSEQTSETIRANHGLI